MIADKRDPANHPEATCGTCEQVEVDCRCAEPEDTGAANAASIGAEARQVEDAASAVRVYTTRDHVDARELSRLIAHLETAVSALREESGQ